MAACCFICGSGLLFKSDDLCQRCFETLEDLRDEMRHPQEDEHRPPENFYGECLLCLSSPCLCRRTSRSWPYTKGFY